MNVIFNCNLGKRAKVGRILIEGVSEEDDRNLHQTLSSPWAKVSGASLKTGQKYSWKRTQKGMDRMRGYYRPSGRLAPKFDFQPRYDSDSNTADLHFKIDPGQILDVKIEGAKIWKRTLRKLVPIYQEGAADQYLVDQGARNLKNYFQSKSYFDAAVSADTENAADRLTITYRVDLGTKHKVSRVLFTNNKYFSDPELQERISINKAKFLFGRGKYSDSLLKKSTDSLVAMYRNEGFSSVKIVQQIARDGKFVDVEFVITEGPRDKVHSLEIADSRGPVEVSFLGRSLRMLPGKPYSAHHLAEDRSQLLARYLNRGYPNATLEANVRPTVEGAHEFDVKYEIKEGQLIKIQELVLLGPEHSKPDFIENVAGKELHVGQPLSQQQLFESESALYGLGIFDWASVTGSDFAQGASMEPVLVRVQESKRSTLDLGGGIEVIPRSGNVPVGSVALPGLPPIDLGDKFTVSQESFFGPRGSLQYARHDIRGRAETATIGFVMSRLDQRGTFTYADPYLHGSRWSSLFSLTGERTTENSIYTAVLGTASFQFERQLNKKKTQKAVFGYLYQRTDLTDILIPDLVLPQDEHVRVSGPQAQYLRDTRDRPLDAHHGQFQSVSFLWASKSLSSSADFMRFLAQTSFYKPVTSNLVWANNFRVGIAIPFGNSLVPLSESFFTGGADSLRGFPINGAGPQRPVQVCSNPQDPSTCSLISVPVGGKLLAIVNSEVRFPLRIYKGLGAAVFYDGGNVYSAINARQFADNYTNSVGIGLRYNTKVGPIRIDLGHNLKPIPGVKATQYFITLGQAF
ncbi:MAG TPA: BamA/TamA family outer membrane protein [Candidatus Acidoferrum sp.]